MSQFTMWYVLFLVIGVRGAAGDEMNENPNRRRQSMFVNVDPGIPSLTVLVFHFLSFSLSFSFLAYNYVCVCVCVRVHEQGKDADASTGVFILVIYAMPVLSSVIIPVLVDVCNGMAAK